MKEKRNEISPNGLIFCPNVGKKRRLTKKDRLFCFYYAESGNRKDAAIRCGEAKETADSQAALWLQRPEIIQQVRQLQKEHLEENIREFVIMTLKQMARDDPGEWLPSLLLAGEYSETEPIRLLNVSEFKRRGNDQMEIKFIDRITILEKLLELSQSDGSLKELYQELLDPHESQKTDE